MLLEPPTRIRANSLHMLAGLCPEEGLTKTYFAKLSPFDQLNYSSSIKQQINLLKRNLNT